MLNHTDQEISASMLRIWGRDAADVALGYADQSEILGNTLTAARWRNVARLVEIQRAIINSAKITALLDGL
jgi:hypothetical protein